MTQNQNRNNPLDVIFYLIEKNKFKPSVYASASIFHRKVIAFFKNFENHSNNILSDDFNEEINCDFQYSDIFTDEYIFALLSLSCKVNDFTMSNKLIYNFLDEKLSREIKNKDEEALHEKMSENISSKSDEKNNQHNYVHEDKNYYLDTSNTHNFIRRIQFLEFHIPTLFSYSLHVPCPFTRLLGLIICLNERGKLNISDDQEKNHINIDKLFNLSSNNLKKILLDEFLLSYKTNEMAMAAIPIEKSLFENLMMGDEIDFQMIENIRSKNKIKTEYVNNE